MSSEVLQLCVVMFTFPNYHSLSFFFNFLKKLRASTLVNPPLGFIEFFKYFLGGVMNSIEPLSIVLLH